MGSLSTLANQIAPGFKGCPKFAISDALMQAARRLCTEGLVWRETTSAINVSAGQESYTITPPAPSSVVIKVIKAWFGGCEMTPITPDLAYDKYGRSSFVITGTPEHYCSAHSGSLDLYPVPSSSLGSGLVAVVALSPSIDAMDVPDWIVQRYSDTLIKGARAILMLHPDEAWTNPNMAGIWEQRFSSDIDAARLAAERGNTRARRRTTSHWY